MNAGTRAARCSCAARIRRYTLPKAHAVRRGVRARCRSRSRFSSYPDETTRAVRSRAPGSALARDVGRCRAGARHRRPAAADDGSGVRHARDGRCADRASARADAAQRCALSGGRLPRLADRRVFRAAAAALAAALAHGHDRQARCAARDAACRRAPRRVRRLRVATQTGDFFLVVYPSPALGDGRGANKPWLQELPDPVTQDCLESWVEMHPATARAARHRSAATTSR